MSNQIEIDLKMMMLIVTRTMTYASFISSSLFVVALHFPLLVPFFYVFFFFVIHFEFFLLVITAWREPVPGYTEGMHGINGWCLAVGRGVLRSMYCQPNYPCNIVQADLVVNGIILLGYERGKSM